jgi:pimeloyl-ACP methyl ester carboxylesterase
MSRHNHTPAMFVREPSTPHKGNIIFIHDAWHGAWCWDEYFTKDFSDKGFRCITFNLPGHGAQLPPQEMNKLGMEDYVDALAAVVAHCDEPPFIIGHGLGALVLQQYLQQHTCRMAILMSPMPSNGYWPRLLRLLKNFNTWKGLRNKDLFQIISKPSVAKSVFFTRQTDSVKANDWHARLCGESYRVFRELKNIDIKPISSSITPTLVVGGGRDGLISVKEFQRTSRFHDAGLIIIPHMGHDMMLDHGHQWLVDLLINCMDIPAERPSKPVISNLKVAASVHRKATEPALI